MLGNPWWFAGHLVGVACLVVVLILGLRWGTRFGPYGVGGWRETCAVSFLCLYGAMGWIVRPQEGVLKESTWIVCIIIQGIILACALYLEGWFRGNQGLTGCMEARKLAHQTCWHLFAACWTALAAAIIVAGVVISFGGAGKVGERVQGEEDLVCVIKYLVVTVIAVFLWMMRPCLQKSVTIISGLQDGGEAGDRED